MFLIYLAYLAIHGPAVMCSISDFDIHTNNTTNYIYQDTVVDCIVTTINKYVPCGMPIALVHNNYYFENVATLLSNRSCYTFIARSFRIDIDKLNLWTNVYIFYVDNYEELLISFTGLSKDITWNPKAHMYVVIKHLHISEYSQIFQVFLNLNVYNVFLITKSIAGTFQMHTYHPFDGGNCGKSINELVSINNCEKITSIKMDYEHLENKSQNCIINVAAADDTPNVIFDVENNNPYLEEDELGIEQYILENIAAKENLTIQYVYLDIDSDYGVILSNMTITGLLGFLENNTAHIVMGGFLLMKNRIRFFEFIWGYSYANVCVFIPAKGEENWKIVFEGFSVGTWLLIVSSFLFTTLVIITIRRFLLGDEDKKRVLLNIWGYLYGHTDTRLFRFKKTRKLMIIWIWFAFLISSFYTSALYSLLSRKVKVKNIKQQSLDNLPWEPCISDPIREFYEFTFNEILPGKIKPNCRKSDDTLDTVANFSKAYTLEMDYSYIMREHIYVDENGNRKLDSWKHSRDLMLAMYTRRGFPLLDKFQRYTTYHLETGLLKRQLSVIYDQYVSTHKHFKKSFKIFHLTDFRIHYAVLLFGYVISIICFIIEINT